MRFRSLRNKLALLFFAITATAFGVIYFLVVPQLEQNLEREKMTDLRRVANGSGPSLDLLIGRGDIRAPDLDRRVRAIADAAGARVTLLSVPSCAARRSRLVTTCFSSATRSRCRIRAMRATRTSCGRFTDGRCSSR